MSPNLINAAASPLPAEHFPWSSDTELIMNSTTRTRRSPTSALARHLSGREEISLLAVLQ